MSDNIFVYKSSSSEYETSSEEEDEEIKQNSEFMNNTSVEEYLKNRNTIFTKDIETIDILIENDGEFTNNKFYFSSNNESGKTYKNVIDVSLLKGFIKTGTADNIVKVHVNNVPHRACIQNKDEKNIIDIIPLSNGVASTAGTTMIDYNYFFPIELDHLDIEFSYVKSSAPSIDYFSLVFRLTIVKNLNLLK
jgi:hypothetical protein